MITDYLEREDRLWKEFFFERFRAARARVDGYSDSGDRRASHCFIKAIGILRGLDDEDENAWDSLYEEADERYWAYREV